MPALMASSTSTCPSLNSTSCPCPLRMSGRVRILSHAFRVRETVLVAAADDHWIEHLVAAVGQRDPPLSPLQLHLLKPKTKANLRHHSKKIVIRP